VVVDLVAFYCKARCFCSIGHAKRRRHDYRMLRAREIGKLRSSKLYLALVTRRKDSCWRCTVAARVNQLRAVLIPVGVALISIGALAWYGVYWIPAKQ